MLFALLSLLLAASAERPFGDERHLLDRRLETLRRILPDGPNPLEAAALVRELAQKAKLQNVEALARPPQEGGGRGDVPVDLTATGRFGEIERFFRQVSLSHRLVDVESLGLTATPDDTVRLTALLHVPHRPAKLPLPAPPDGTRNRVAGVPKPQAEAFLRDQALALAKSETIAQLRRSRRNPRLFLTELAAIVRDRPVTISYASLGEEFVVRGLTLGQGPVRGLETRFERGFFRVNQFLVRRQAACLQFEAVGKCPIAGADAELPIPADDPFVQDESPCRIDRDAMRGFVVRNPNPKGGKGPLTLRVRDMDLADVFQVLHQLTGQGFVIDADVVGRASADLAGVTLDEALAALQKGTGIKVSDAGVIRRVSVGKAAPRPAGPLEGPTASFLLKRAEIRELLAVMTDLDPTLAALGPQGSLGHLSLWAKDTSLGTLRAAILETAGLGERFEEGRRILERSPGSEDAVVPVAGETPERRLVLRPQELAVSEFEPAGIASAGDAWRVWAYSPSGALNLYKAGDRLADGSLTSVDSTDVVLETDEGPLRVLFPPLPR
jgi:hypothetical protein